MINTISHFPEINSNYDLQKKTKIQTKQIKQDNTKKVTSNSDSYTSDNPKQNLKIALKNGDVEYYKPFTILWGIITIRDEYYVYNCKGNETIGNIKKKFGIPDRVIFNLNRIHDDDFIPEKGHKIDFDYKSTY